MSLINKNTSNLNCYIGKHFLLSYLDDIEDVKEENEEQSEFQQRKNGKIN